MADPAANERLTAAAAVPVSVLLAIEGITLLFLRPLLSMHVFVGILLVLPVLLKITATGWRFARYYLGDGEYVRRGPPRLLLRLVAPLLVLSSLAVLATGIALVFTQGHTNLLLTLHKTSFIVWAPAFAVHVLAYVSRVPRLVLAATWVERLAPAAVLAVAVLATVMTVGLGHPVFDGDADLF